jgi:hypothetical protein
MLQAAGKAPTPPAANIPHRIRLTPRLRGRPE